VSLFLLNAGSKSLLFFAELNFLPTTQIMENLISNSTFVAKMGGKYNDQQ
jgi:hypothetical protein